MRKILFYLMICFFLPINMNAKKKTFGKEKTLYWEILDDSTLIISGYGKMPDFLDKNDSKAPWRKEFGRITKVIIENGVESISSGAFHGEHSRKLASIVIPPSVKYIGMFAFYSQVGKVFISDLAAWCKCESVQVPHRLFLNGKEIVHLAIPETVTEIHSSAFEDCKSLKSVTMTDVVERIGRDSFSGCTNLLLVKIGNSVRTIASGAFWECTNLSSIKLSNSVKEEPTEKVQYVNLINDCTLGRDIGECQFVTYY